MKKIFSIIVIMTAAALNVVAQEASEISVGQSAPEFTLPNAEGKEVSLSDMGGKWVVLDFWGSWCRWCIKGIPDMKNSYEDLKDKAEFIGIACRDKKEAWLAALKQYELPWVNVWVNPEDSSILKAYGLRGFPTKMIIDPKGIIRNITIGEDPEFYTILKELVK